jgi:THUMP domain-containing protein
MTITLQDIKFLSSPAGEALLQNLAGQDLSDNRTLYLLTQLRQSCTPQEAGAAVEMARLRLKAGEKFGDDARRTFFTREGLEQASDGRARRCRASHMLKEIARHHARKPTIVDACCGIGSDSLAFAQAGADVLGLDVHPVRIEIALCNGAVLGSAAVFDAHLLDDTIAYFTTDVQPVSPWLRAWQILDWMPFNLKRLRDYLGERHVGRVTVKKRGSPITPETLIPQLKLKGGESRVLVLTRCRRQPIVLVCADYDTT